MLKIRERGKIMKENEKVMENEEVKEEMAVTTVQDLSGLTKSTNTKAQVFTNITDNKKIFNLENKVDELLNDCEGELIRVKEVLIKKYEKPMKEPMVDEETGEILKDKEYSMCCILIDTEGKSYATGSKVFTIQMMRYIQMFGLNEPVEIKIVKNKQNSGNKALGFELV